MSRKYYEAYDDRYRQVHANDLQWFDDASTPIITEVMDFFQIRTQSRLLEIGCGEGRDAAVLLERGYNLLATDLSSEAIHYCKTKFPANAHRFQVLDCINGKLAGTFDFIYAVAVIHMLVTDEDRDAFYAFIRNHLEPDGIALVCSMGNGDMERASDPAAAFNLQERLHEKTGKAIHIASTSCRMVRFSTFEQEISRNGLVVLQQGLTSAAPDFPILMYAVVRAAKNP